tara:strand:+ start:70 stop:471 length:402 start_codon:yes stop_codon:yes gene_type:complete
MAAGRYSFVIEQGATTNFEIAYTDSNSIPVDLTNHQARMQIRPNIGSDTVYITLSSSLGPCKTGLNLNGSNGTTPPTSGTIGIYIAAISSSQLDFTKGYYDLEIASGSGDCYVVTRILEGEVKLSKNITLGSF